MASIAGRAIIVTKTNKSGGSLAKGDTVIVDAANDNAVTTTTTGSYTGVVGVVVEENGIANNLSGRVQFGGHCGLATPNASVTRGHYALTHTVAKQCTDGGASRVVGAFGVFTTGGTTPEIDLFSQPDGSSASGNVATDPIWDAAGDLAVGTGANTAAKLVIGSAGAALALGNGAVIWNAGSSFPASKATNDRYYRTDLGMEFYWDGTRWLSTTMYAFQIPPINDTNVQPLGATSPVVSHRGVLDTDILTIWMIDFRVSMRTAATNDGTHFWTVSLQAFGGSAITGASVNGSADTAAVIVRHVATMGEVLAATNFGLQVSSAKTSTPGNLDVLTAQVRYRYIAV